jgi:hypothetical protein
MFCELEDLMLIIEDSIELIAMGESTEVIKPTGGVQFQYFRRSWARPTHRIILLVWRYGKVTGAKPRNDGRWAMKGKREFL